MGVDGKILTITIDLSARGKASSTGKTRLIATTGGSQSVDCDGREGVKVAVNVMVPPGSIYKASASPRKASTLRKSSAKVSEVSIEDTSDQCTDAEV